MLKSIPKSIPKKITNFPDVGYTGLNCERRVTKMIPKNSPSLMCANVHDLGETFKTFEAHGIEMLHIDIMDGHFVPNFTLGTNYVKNIRRLTNIPLDFHLMVENPENMLSYFTFEEGDRVSVHVESTRHLQEVLVKLRQMGAKPMVAINPATPFSAIENVFDDIDGVLVMAVNPGFAGQKLIPAML